MASINGISIKGLKRFRDHEGSTAFQGNVYYRGKLLGFWSQDAWGASDQYDFKESLLDEELEKYKKSDRVRKELREFCSLDYLMYDLLNLMDDEKEYKKGLKEGHSVYVVASDGYHVAKRRGNGKKELVEKAPNFSQFREECRKHFSDDWDGRITIYDSLDDFNVTV